MQQDFKNEYQLLGHSLVCLLKTQSNQTRSGYPLQSFFSSLTKRISTTIPNAATYFKWNISDSLVCRSGEQISWD